MTTEICFAAITRINRGVHMLQQSIGPLAVALHDLGRPRQYCKFGRRLDDPCLFGLGPASLGSPGSLGLVRRQSTL